MEEAKELGADVVRVLLVAPRGNEAFWSSLPGERWHALAGSSPVGVADAFRSVLRRPDRFAWLDSASLVGEQSLLSEEFKARYRHLGASAEVALASAPTGAEVSLAVDRAISALTGVSGEGSVLRRFREYDTKAVDSLPAPTRSAVLAAATELAELARRLSVGSLNDALSELGADGVSRKELFDPDQEESRD
jgi:hypothetical protein